jgi:4-diphosphocytidyl-2-C-methyl-D-erythritol kinase
LPLPTPTPSSTGSADRPDRASPLVLRTSRLSNWDYLAGHARNDFEEVVFERLPQLAEARQMLLREGALLALLTGSGSTIYGVFRDQARLLRAAAAASELGLKPLPTRSACPPSPPPFG